MYNIFLKFHVSHNALICPECGSSNVRIISQNDIHVCNNCGFEGLWDDFDND
jgi:predicted RNA-binding Zn-ribbon protein involved in translation (DUF1610 family)